MPDNPEPAPPSQPVVPPSSGSPANEGQARMWNMLCHLSALAGFIGIPFGNLLGPLIVWQIKKNEIPSVEMHGKEALNFQITIMIGVIIGLLLSFFCIGIPIIIAVAVCGLIFPIIAGIKANDGKEYRYPWSLKLVK